MRLVVVGLGFGDEGKGTITDYLVRAHHAQAVVRFCGGAQAAHRVVDLDGREHVFAQFGSGTFVPGVETFLSRHVVVNPLNLMIEAEHLWEIGVRDALDRLSIDGAAQIVTPFHVAVNRIRELIRGADRHGSCGEGIGEARSDAMYSWAPVVYASDAFFTRELEEKLAQIQRRKLETATFLLSDPDLNLSHRINEWIAAEMHPLHDPTLPASLADAYGQLRPHIVPDWTSQLRDLDAIVFEGAQGILLDETHGFQPHTTWSRTTSFYAHQLLDQAGYRGERVTIGVTRCYATRHGAGPLPTFDHRLNKPRVLQDAAGNVEGPWQGRLRVGYLDPPLLRYAIACDLNIDEIALTCLDRLPDVAEAGGWYVGADREIDQPALADDDGPEHEPVPAVYRDAGSFPDFLESRVGLPVRIVSSGPTAAEKTERA